MRDATRRGVLALAAGAAAAGCSGPAETLPPDPPAARAPADAGRFEAAADAAHALLAAHRAALGAPSLSAAIGIGGALVWAEAIGFADVAAARPATPATRYRIGSTSKAVTATLTGRLLEQGLIDLDAPIADYKQNLPEHWRALTLRQLHSHTAGIPGYENNRDLIGQWRSWRRETHYDSVDAALAEFDGAPLVYPPGEGFHYSSFDVVLASAVLEAAARTPFLALLRREVLEPAGMNETGADVREHVSDRANFYDRAGGGVRASRPVDLSDRWASGGLIATSRDLVRLGLGYLDRSLLSAATVETLWTPQRLKNGAVNEQSYALGWRSQRWNDTPFGDDVWVVHHGGISMGAMSWLALYPAQRIALAMNINVRARAFSDFNAAGGALAALFHAAA